MEKQIHSLIDIIFVTNKSSEEVSEQLKILGFYGGNIIFTGLNESASANRNYGLLKVKSDIFIMIDDDMFGFYHGWIEDLIKPMLMDETIIITSARLLNSDGSIGSMMGNNRIYNPGYYEAKKSMYKNYYRLPTACLAIRKNPVAFNCNFIGSGYEDTDYMNRINENFPDLKMVINNDCKLVHLNEQKNQGGRFFAYNKKYYLTLYPDDTTVLHQKDWTK